MKKILFVDDEINILKGLERMLRGMRDEWHMAFAQSGEEALQILDKDSFDIIVTDMRMPVMDGAELLAHVKEKHPQTARIVLSGHSDIQLIFKSLKLSHQYIAKPCDADSLKKIIARACTIRDILTNTELKKVVSQMGTLPILPSSYQQITKEFEAKDVSINKIGEIISKDVAMTAQILHLVNSAFFGLPRHVSTPTEACMLIGLDIIKALVLSVNLFSQFKQKSMPHGFLNDLWEHSMIVARFSQIIAKSISSDKILIDNSFLGGLLHDIGKLVFAASLDKKYAQVISIAQERNIPLWHAEKKLLGATHGEVGAYLMGLWGLGGSIVETIAFHNTPDLCPEHSFNHLSAVYMGNEIWYSLNKLQRSSEGINISYLDKLNMSDKISDWEISCGEILSKIKG
ncbi:MAG: HDOD domain-containing protein [Desulfobacterales bacterium]|nr:HDOD domain-containing protein [Desulfobacterales bacterium]